jgi:UDP-N-acetyl-2-amino-2-deoxyglucuronate dehydrogenase
MKLAIIGLGLASKPHFSALRQIAATVQIAGVFARKSDRRDAVANELGVRAYKDISEIAADDDVDAVILITPPNARADIVRELAGAGKHILMEKPVERTLEAAENLVKVCEAAGVTLGVVLQQRFRAGAEKLQELTNSKALGRIAVVRLTVPWWREQSYYDAPGRGTYTQDGGGVLITQAIHSLDLMLAVAGSVSVVQAMTATTILHDTEVEDFAIAGLKFVSGAVGSVVATTASHPGGAEYLEISAEKGSVCLEAGELTVNWLDGETERFGELTGTGGGRDPMDFPSDWHRDLIVDFCGAVSKGDAPRVSGRDALDVHRLISAIERSAQTGQLVEIGGPG